MPLFQRKKIVNAEPKAKRVSHTVVYERPNKVQMKMDSLKSAVDMATDQEFCQRVNLMELYEGTAKDAHVKSQRKIAINKALSEPFVLLINNAERADITEMFKKTWFSNFCTIVVDSELWGYTLAEFGYPDPDKVWSYVKVVPPKNVDPFKKMVLTSTNGTEGIVYAGKTDALFLLEIGDPDNIGDYESVTREVIWKNFARSDWSEYNERFGKPLLDIACNTDDPKEVADKTAMAAGFGTNNFVVRDHDDAVQMISPMGSANGSQFEPLAKFCDESISKIINGQTGTSDQKSFVGAAEVHERVLDDFTKGRLRNIQGIVNDSLIPFLIKKGLPVANAKFKYPILEDDSNTKKTAESTDPNDPTDKKAPVAKKANSYPW